MQDQGEGIAQVRQGITALRATGGAVLVPYFCTVLAEVYDHLGHTEDGLQALAEAHTLVGQQEERWWEAEVYRLRGVLLLRQTVPQQAEAEACFRQALDVARRQEAKSLELRAATSRASGPKPTTCWRRSMAGSPRALIRPTSRRPKRCLTHWRERNQYYCGTSFSQWFQVRS